MPLYGVFVYIIAWIVVSAFRLIPENRIESYNDFLIALVCFWGVYYHFYVYRLFDRKEIVRLCWLLFAIGLAFEGIGHLLYFLLEWIREDLVEFPSIADAPIVVADFLWIVGLRIYYYQQTRGGVVPSLTRTFVANTIFIVLVVLQLSFFTIPVLYDASEALWIRIAYQIYPTLDLSLAYFCLHLSLAWLSRGFAHAAKPWTVLVLAFVVFLIADYGYEIYLILDSYHSYLWINPSWMLGYLLVVVAAYLQWNLMLHLSPLEEDIVSLNE